MSRYSYRKTYRWSADVAYLAGLMASDGCLSKDGRHLFMVSKDMEIIDATRAITNTHAKEIIKTGQFNTQAFHYQFSDVALYDFLYCAGITPAKSKTIRAVTVPDEYYADFLRGYFDGDGTTYGYRDRRWKNSHMYYVGFISASYDFMLWLQSQNSRLAKASPGKIKAGPRAFTLSYAKADSVKLFSTMYDRSPTWSLTRKYKKLKGFIVNDPHAKISLDARVL